uniref:Uncharacterized protein n=1 Tax=Romanomermis culicivorax TaxID=13658 RepID=A0A915K9F5_ROMCU
MPAILACRNADWPMLKLVKRFLSCRYELLHAARHTDDGKVDNNWDDGREFFPLFSLKRLTGGGSIGIESPSYPSATIDRGLFAIWQRGKSIVT